MSRLSYTIRSRAAQIHASTLFAVILAIVAGLIFAWVFKMVFLHNKPKPVTAAPTRKITVAATNLFDKMLIQNGQVKTVAVSEEEYNTIVNDPKNRSRVLLTGNQPVGRTTIKPIRSEEPVFEDQLEPMAYPEPISSRLAQGKRAVNIEVPPTGAMLQVGDRVDVYCTLANDNALSSGSGTITAALAKGLRVIARFGTTRTAATPPAGARSYTLEASPYRANLIDLAKSIKGTFTLLVSPRVANEEGSIAQVDTSLDDPQTDRVTTEDLARVFGIQPPPPPMPVMNVERFSGINRTGGFTFPGYVNYNVGDGKQAEKSAGNTLPMPKSTGNGNGNGNGSVANPPAVSDKAPAADKANPVPPGALRNRSPIAPAAGGAGSTSMNYIVPRGATVTAAYGPANNYGFKPAGQDPKGCPTCGPGKQ